jgi:DnaJ domain
VKPPPITLPDTDDPYVLLDVRPGASGDQIRRAYLRKVKVWKPDRHPAEFRRIREAYDRLREQERWFDALHQAGVVVRRATERAAAPPGAGTAPKAETGNAHPPEANEQAEHERANDAARAEVQRALEDDALGEHDEEPVEDEDVDALIAALELELREHPEAGDDDDRYDGADDEEDEDERSPYLLDEHRRRRARASASAERLEALEQAVHADLEAGRFGEAADRLLAPGTEAEAVHPEFAPLLLEVCCAVVWELPPRFAALVARYGDLVSTHDTEHHDGALLHRRILLDELSAWRAAVAADWPELHRFMVLGSSLRAPAEAELGLRLGRRAVADPTGFLMVLARAAQSAPGVVTLYVTMAERWAGRYGRLPLQRPARPRPTVEQAAAALAHAAEHHRRVRWEQARPLLVTLATMLVLLLAPTPIIELAVLGVVILLWAWRAWARGPVARIYAQVVRPTAAAWLWATSATPSELAAALRAKLPAPGTWGAVLHPGDLGEYPERLRDDLALLAFGVTAPMIPRLRTSGSTGPSAS